ncbi:MAG: FmdE family protein [Actinomycetota bacterium]|nr:FmdE family protein [Actinomycetota bacterium]
MTVEEDVVQQVVAFHGHLCPGLAMGIQAARIALDRIGPHAHDEEVVAVTETDMCAVDAVQVLTGCTFGKGNLIHQDWGKNAFTFFRRSDGKALRVVARPEAWQRDPEHQELFAKVRSGDATDQERARFRELHEARSWSILEADPEQLFEVHAFLGGPPPRARIHASLPCAGCGEAVMETRIRRLEGRDLCQPCFDAKLHRHPAGAIGAELTGPTIPA